MVDEVCVGRVSLRTRRAKKKKPTLTHRLFYRGLTTYCG
ncbi:unknown protein [Cronobacter turicensis z3032]|uniref:Uncharacterized protein n=1 Tax=Cronobacter turicensis (strain DSM 18703 / CCUG 55852 / LMG 23827 / z3032) TaxID=693216 RepID=C9Y2Z9_CROTZ|nr:unknown protein [Cronobacter turicensis z3032]